VNLVLQIRLWCDTEGSVLILPKLSRLHVCFDSIIDHHKSVLFVSIEVLLTRQTVK
jgi:hypothetical protein